MAVCELGGLALKGGTKLLVERDKGQARLDQIFCVVARCGYPAKANSFGKFLEGPIASRANIYFWSL